MFLRIYGIKSLVYPERERVDIICLSLSPLSIALYLSLFLSPPPSIREISNMI
jgi:hypothetical protein